MNVSLSCIGITGYSTRFKYLVLFSSLNIIETAEREGKLKPGDTIMGMSLAAGGHLTHGAPPNESGKWFNAIQYGLEDNGLIDYDQVERFLNETDITSAQPGDLIVIEMNLLNFNL